MTSVGCASNRSPEIYAVNLPPGPSCMAPVAVPEVRVGDDARAALARHRAALRDANGNLICSRDWYKHIRDTYAVTQ